MVTITDEEARMICGALRDKISWYEEKLREKNCSMPDWLRQRKENYENLMNRIERHRLNVSIGRKD